MNESTRIAMYLAQAIPNEVTEGIQMFLDGRIESNLLAFKWVPQDNKPDSISRADWILFLGKYWVRERNIEPKSSVEFPFEGEVAPKKKCKVCNNSMEIYKVTINCKKSNPNGWKTLWLCPNCNTSEYSNLTPMDEIRLIYARDDEYKEFLNKVRKVS